MGIVVYTLIAVVYDTLLSIFNHGTTEILLKEWACLFCVMLGSIYESDIHLSITDINFDQL